MSILNERRSIRNYDKNHKIDRKILNEILELSFRAPSTQNLQPTRLVVLESHEAKEKIKSSLYGNHLQLETSSAFIVVFTDLDKYRYTEKILNQSYEAGLMPLEVKERQLKNISSVKDVLTKEAILQDGVLDAGLFSMQLMLAAKEFGYDTCPIGGFNKSVVNELLNIEESLVPVLIISIGKANEEGYVSKRLPLEDTVKFL